MREIYLISIYQFFSILNFNSSIFLLLSKSNIDDRQRVKPYLIFLYYIIIVKTNSRSNIEMDLKIATRIIVQLRLAARSNRSNKIISRTSSINPLLLVAAPAIIDFACPSIRQDCKVLCIFRNFKKSSARRLRCRSQRVWANENRKRHGHVYICVCVVYTYVDSFHGPLSKTATFDTYLDRKLSRPNA